MEYVRTRLILLFGCAVSIRPRCWRSNIVAPRSLAGFSDGLVVLGLFFGSSMTEFVCILPTTLFLLKFAAREKLAFPLPIRNLSVSTASIPFVSVLTALVQNCRAEV